MVRLAVEVEHSVGDEKGGMERGTLFEHLEGAAGSAL